MQRMFWLRIPLAMIITITSLISCKEKQKALPVQPVSKTPVSIDVTEESMRDLQRSSIRVTGKDGEARDYEGVSLIRLLDRAGVSSAKLKPKELVKRYLVARGADGFETVFSLAEIDTAFAARPVIIADHVNGAKLAADRGPFQLIAQGDLRPTRNCYQLVKLTVYEANTEKE